MTPRRKERFLHNRKSKKALRILGISHGDGRGWKQCKKRSQGVVCQGKGGVGDMSPKLYTIPKPAALSSSPPPTLMTDIIWPWGNLVTVWGFEAHLFLSPIFVCLSHFCTGQKPDVASTQPSWPCLIRVPGAAYLFQERERERDHTQTDRHRHTEA